MDLDKWMVLYKETQKLYYNHNVWDPKSLYLQRFSFIVESSSSIGSEDVPFRNGSTMQKEDTHKKQLIESSQVFSSIYLVKRKTFVE